MFWSELYKSFFSCSKKDSVGGETSPEDGPMQRPSQRSRYRKNTQSDGGGSDEEGNILVGQV